MSLCKTNRPLFYLGIDDSSSSETGSPNHQRSPSTTSLRHLSSSRAKPSRDLDDDSILDADSDLTNPLSQQRRHAVIRSKSTSHSHNHHHHPPSYASAKPSHHIENSADLQVVSDLLLRSIDVMDDENRESSWCWRNEVRKCLSRRKLRESIDKIYLEKVCAPQSQSV